MRWTAAVQHEAAGGYRGRWRHLRVPTADRLFRVYRAIRQGIPLRSRSPTLTGYDLWFLAQMQEIAAVEEAVRLQECQHHLGCMQDSWHLNYLLRALPSKWVC